MEPLVGGGSAASFVAPIAMPTLTRDSFNSRSLGRGLNAHVKQVGTRKSISFLPFMFFPCTSYHAFYRLHRQLHSHFPRPSFLLELPHRPYSRRIAPTIIIAKMKVDAVSPLTKVKQSRVLMVGAGGIGCELLKNLVLTGFGEIHIVDLDTIDLSNLNRQFLFRHEHIKKSKALV